MQLDAFPAYTDFGPAVPVHCLTPDLPGCFHRFFDTSPISPSGRYCAVTRLRTEDRLPAPGEMAEVVLIDLIDGSHRVVAETACFGTQLGAQVQWGADDSQLIYNELCEQPAWTPRAVVFDPATGTRRALGGPVYMASRGGSRLASPCLLRTELTQEGYGFSAPGPRLPLNHGAVSYDGVTLTEVASGAASQVVSIAEIAQQLGPDKLELSDEQLATGGLYGFHVKWNPQGTRLMYVLRYRRHDGKPVPGRGPQMITMKADGSDVQVALSRADWSKGGHHPDWCPDGEHIIMNLNLAGDGLRFVQVRYDGTDLRALHDTIPGSGHPTMHPDGRHVLTDEYTNAQLAYPDGSVPIRWVDLEAGTDQELVRIPSAPAFFGPQRQLRIDPHPAWDRSFRYVTFNGSRNGSRAVYLADLSSVL
ncbi:MAG: hypothetical protein PF961_06945 [Planctomycetota bacterium]|jgi:hypothetical protein|nr:hypothetical protein [Planctomycetota bacterium]